MINNLVDLLKKYDIKNICISPGLRNTQISLPFINNDEFNCYSILDERSSGYFALGMALKTNTASVLICTSGTATANYLPAIIEASHSKIPLIIITADRPKSLLNSGENQTINQKDIYGGFVRSSIDFNTTENILDDINNSLKFINIDNGDIALGPIHFNVHLDDFKTIDNQKNNYSLPKKKSKKINQTTFNWHQFPFEDIFNIHNYKSPLIIIGRLKQRIDLKLVEKLSKHLKAPIFTDVLSQIRFNNTNTCSFYDHYINQEHLKPDLIIRIGQKPISKKLCQKIKMLEQQGKESLDFSSLLIDETGRFNDDANTIIKINYKDFIDFIINNTKKNKNDTFYNYIYQLEQKVANIIHDENSWSELIIAKACLLSIKNDENFIIGNSMPIRYIDMLGKTNSNYNINTYSNRGASGIDGIIATSIGIASQTIKKNILLIGDLSFIYDQSSLLITKQYGVNLTIVVINNNGGGIFSLLPVSKILNKKIFTKYWTTPQNINLKNIATLYDCNYEKVNTIKQLENSLLKCNNKGINIIDAQVDINTNKKRLSKFKERIKKGIV